MKLLRINLSIIALLAAFACGGKKESEDWTEMEAFHEIMADSYHPLKDDGNLGPAKSKAADMAASAEKWAAAPLPSKVDDEKTKVLIEELRAGTKAFSEKVNANAADSVLAADLEKLHESFHQIMESWHKSGHEHH